LSKDQEWLYLSWECSPQEFGWRHYLEGIPSFCQPVFDFTSDV
jgi:hypothetical protein